jgi:phosphate transport system ATP-binding protein
MPETFIPPPNAPPESKSAAALALMVRNLSVFFGRQAAVKNISLDVAARAVTAIIGPSGCGKSTFLRAINRMHDLNPEARMEGEIKLFGDDIYSRNVESVTVRRRIGMVFQKSNPFPTMSIVENVTVGLRLNGLRNRKLLAERTEQSLRMAALWDEVKDRLHKSALGLSGGQQQRLCIARTLAVEPDVVLMDEPCSALDPIATGAIEDLMQEIKSKYTIVIVTHNMQQATRVSDRTAFFSVLINEQSDTRTGVLVEYDRTAKLFQDPSDSRTRAYVTGRMG